VFTSDMAGWWMKAFISDALLEIRSHLGKTLLTGFAISIGVLSVVGVAIESEFARVAVRANSEMMFGRAITVSAPLVSSSWSPDIVASMASSLDNRVGDSERSTWYAQLSLASQILVTDPLSRSPIVGAQLDLIAGSIGGVRRLPLLSDDTPAAPGDVNFVFINRSAADQLTTPIGNIWLRKPTNVEGALFAVRAVIDDGDPKPHVYADLASYVRYDPGTPAQMIFNVFAHSASLSADQLASALTDSVVESSLTLQAPISRVDDDADSQVGARAVRRGFIFASIVTFIVAAVGTANVGLSSVRERRRDFAIRRAVGFTQRRVALTVLAAQMLIGLIASIGSVLVCATFAYGLLPGLSTSQLVARPDFPWLMVLVAIGAGLCAAALGAIAPSLAAARSSLASVLR
jgi:FtsX-like permease family